MDTLLINQFRMSSSLLQITQTIYDRTRSCGLDVEIPTRFVQWSTLSNGHHAQGDCKTWSFL